MTDVALIIKIDSSDVGKATIALDKLAKEGVQAEVATKSLTSATSTLMAAIRGAASAFGLYKLAGLISESAQLNARFETMGIVMNGVGYNAGYSANQMASFETALRKTGISMIESRENITKMAQAQLDLSKTAELARVAQDAAVIGGLNSSEAFARMVHGIQAGQTETLRTIGINVDFQASYEKLAKELGTTAKNLSETQKAQARMNEVLEYGSRIAGTYEAAMGTAGKQMSSMKRYVEDLKVKLGETFNDALTIAVFGLSDALKDANKEADALSENGSLKSWGRETIEVLAILGDFLKNIAVDIRTVGTVSALAAGQAASLTKAGGLAEFKEISGLYAQVFKERQESMDSMQRTAAAYFATKDEQQQLDANRERNYLTDLAQMRKDYAKEDLATQQAAIKMITDLYYPETVAGPKPKPSSTSTGQDSAQKAANEYASLVKAAKDYAQSLREETQEIGLNAEQVRMLEAARAAAKAPTDALKMSIMQNAQALAVATIAEDANKKALEETEKALKKVQEEREKYLEMLNDNADAAEKALEQMLLEEEALTISEEKHISLSLAIEEVNLQRLEEQRILAILNGDDQAVSIIQREIDARKKLLTLMSSREIRDANKAAAEDAAAEWEKTSRAIENSLTDALMRGFEGGANFASNFADTLKNLFSTLILRPIIQPIAQGAAGMVTGALGMGASSSAGAGDLLSLGSSLTGLMAPGAISTSIGVMAGGIAEMAGATSAMAGSIGLGVATAIPYVGVAIALLSMLGAFSGKPSNKAAYGNVDLSTGALSDIGSQTGKKQASQETMDARDVLVSGISTFSQLLIGLGGTTGVGTVRTSIGERDGTQFAIDGGKLKKYGDNPDEALGKLFEELVAGTSGLADEVKTLLIGFEGVGSEMLAFADALVVIGNYEKANPLSDVLEAQAYAARTLYQQLQESSVATNRLAAAFDGSLDSSMQLAEGLKSQYALELQLIAQIQQALASTQAMFGNSIEQIKLSVMGKEDQYDYWRVKTDEYFAALSVATDPTEIARLSSGINQSANNAYALLDPTQRAGAAPEFIAYLEESNALTTERLNATQDSIVTGHDDLSSKIKEVMMEVAAAMMEAATTPQKVDVNVTIDSEAPANIEVAYG